VLEALQLNTVGIRMLRLLHDDGDSTVGHSNLRGTMGNLTGALPQLRAERKQAQLQVREVGLGRWTSQPTLPVEETFQN
jgi:hypothetical protein